MESIYPKLALCGRKNECARTDTVFFHIYEVSKVTVSLGRTRGMAFFLLFSSFSSSSFRNFLNLEEKKGDYLGFFDLF